ncbi:MAG: hypothetical protein FWE76_07600 [Symbiobacteriaceae bacterium]|nr:hypothetical protein [Symbiobacteriaceae bacterium]
MPSKPKLYTRVFRQRGKGRFLAVPSPSDETGQGDGHARQILHRLTATSRRRRRPEASELDETRLHEAGQRLGSGKRSSQAVKAPMLSASVIPVDPKLPRLARPLNRDKIRTVNFWHHDVSIFPQRDEHRLSQTAQGAEYNLVSPVDAIRREHPARAILAQVAISKQEQTKERLESGLPGVYSAPRVVAKDAAQAESFASADTAKSRRGSPTWRRVLTRAWQSTERGLNQIIRTLQRNR